MLSIAGLAACAQASDPLVSDSDRDARIITTADGPMSSARDPYVSDAPSGLATAIVAGGCFWCVEKDFESVDGVISVKSGYSGGRLDNPDYQTVSYSETGHYEAAEILFDPRVVTYRELIDYYWTTVDPTDDGGQFCDRGTSYRTAVFVTPEQKAEARASLADIQADKPFNDPIITPILDAVTFYDAEDYHQDYYKKKPVRYQIYRSSCGRDARLKNLWGDRAKAMP